MLRYRSLSRSNIRHTPSKGGFITILAHRFQIRSIPSRSNSSSSASSKISTSNRSGRASSPQTLIEKIVQRFHKSTPRSPSDRVRSGDYLSIQPQHILTHDNTNAVLLKYLSFYRGDRGIEPRIASKEQPVFALDHNIQDTSPANVKKYRDIESFANKYGIDFYPAGRGIGHQVKLL